MHICKRTGSEDYFCDNDCDCESGGWGILAVALVPIILCAAAWIVAHLWS